VYTISILLLLSDIIGGGANKIKRWRHCFETCGSLVLRKWVHSKWTTTCFCY